MKIYSKSDIGLVRKTNQDSFYTSCLEDGVAWAVVCDGMGGANGGNVASKLAVEKITEQITSAYRKDMEPNSIKNLLTTAVYNANALIYEKALEEPSLAGMGTTVVVALVTEEMLYIVHAGDSRAYLITSDGINQLTTDHSVVQEMVKSGEITEEQAMRHPRKNIITRALGIHTEIELDYIEASIASKDAVLICTDGLTNYVKSDKIYQYFQEIDKKDLADALISTAKDLGGSDNITVVVITQ